MCSVINALNHNYQLLGTFHSNKITRRPVTYKAFYNIAPLCDTLMSVFITHIRIHFNKQLCCLPKQSIELKSRNLSNSQNNYDESILPLDIEVLI